MGIYGALTVLDVVDDVEQPLVLTRGEATLTTAGRANQQLDYQHRIMLKLRLFLCTGGVSPWSCRANLVKRFRI